MAGNGEITAIDQIDKCCTPFKKKTVLNIKLNIMKGKIWLILVDLGIVVCTFFFIKNILYGYVTKSAFFGAGIILGLIVRNWIQLFQPTQTEKSEKETEKQKSIIKNTPLALALIGLTIFSLFSYSIDEMDDLEYDIRENKSEIEDIEYRVDDLEEHSHYHRW